MVLAARERTSGIIAGASLLAVYALTLAPDITWWDSGEMIAAAHSLGIPHPPGVPLYVLMANVSARVFWWLGPAASVSILSAICTALSCAVAAATITRLSGRIAPGVGAALTAGGMATVWLNATEAEVYAVSLLLSSFMLYSALNAGQREERGWILLTAYCIGLSAALHISALVAAPAAILLASWRADPKRFDISRATLLGGVLLLTIGAGKADLIPAVVGLLAIFGSGSFYRSGMTGPKEIPAAGGMAALTVVLLALSCILFLPIRASLDPAINQGSPTSLAALFDVLSRNQYDVAPLLPRQAPLWLQFANYVQYLDWQVALGLSPSPLPSVPRTGLALAFVALAAFSLWRLRAVAARLSWAALILAACATAGVVVYLNLKAGPSIGYGILADTAPHEVRERDYFFILSFWTFGLLGGAAAVHLTSRLRRIGAAAGLGVAAIPLILNFPVANRKAEPLATLPLRFGIAMLETLPRNAVIFTGGDNDTYPLWYLQTARGMRRDIVVVTLPLLGADWYRAELQRRYGLFENSAEWQGLPHAMRTVANRALNQRRHIAVSIAAPVDERELIRAQWVLAGFHYRPLNMEETGIVQVAGTLVSVPSVEHAALWSEAGLSDSLQGALDPVSRLMGAFLECPSQVRAALAGTADVKGLAMSCNIR